MKVVITILLTLILQTGYSVSANVMKSKPATYTVNQKDPEPIKITVSENCIHVENAPIGSVLEIYSVVGIKVTEITMKQPNGDYTVDIVKGYYIIRIGDTVRKIAIR
ncbi:hypothetical protein [Parabacteroides bouchesdurhonensis]|uniref:hypothetical protein n=1 Tax=Parabacteroides bouchesdurhonensis TaxID=1936995 RepID=UPI000C83A0B6|nr:hypothetical protein [Parabacteroides bouchesdurhonensis]RHJ88971.1 hypothetical protein DW095_14210 [Bacteroides sp. AM07-16]